MTMLLVVVVVVERGFVSDFLLMATRRLRCEGIVARRLGMRPAGDDAMTSVFVVMIMSLTLR